MKDVIIRFAPVTVVAVLVAWCAWPYVELPQEQFDSKQQGLPRISRQLVSPQIRDVASRDPFYPRTQQRSPNATVRQSDPPVDPPQEISTAPRPSSDPAVMLAALKLKATSLYGGHALAVINQELYQVGDEITLESPVKFSCKVALIEHQKVVLEFEGKLHDLHYEDAPLELAQNDGVPSVDNASAQAAGQNEFWEFLKKQVQGLN